VFVRAADNVVLGQSEPLDAKTLLDLGLASAQYVTSGHAVIDGVLEERSGIEPSSEVSKTGAVNGHRFRYEVWADFPNERLRWDYSRTNPPDYIPENAGIGDEYWGAIRTIIWLPDLAVNASPPRTLYLKKPSAANDWRMSIRAFDLRSPGVMRSNEWNPERFAEDEEYMTVEQRWNNRAILELSPTLTHDGNLVRMTYVVKSSQLKVTDTFDASKSYSLVSSRIERMPQAMISLESDVDVQMRFGVYVPVKIQARMKVYSDNLSAAWEHATVSIDWKSINEPTPDEVFDYQRLPWVREAIDGKRELRALDFRYNPRREITFGGDTRQRAAETALAMREAQNEARSEFAPRMVVVVVAVALGIGLAWLIHGRKRRA
jgi:hypothetical protein